MSASVSTATPHLPDLALGRAGRRSRGPSAWAGRTPSTARPAGAPAARGSAGSCRWPCRSRRTCAWSTASSGTSRRTGHACTGTGRPTDAVKLAVVGPVHGLEGNPRHRLEHGITVRRGVEGLRHSGVPIRASIAPRARPGRPAHPVSDPRTSACPAMTDLTRARPQPRPRPRAGHRGRAPWPRPGGWAGATRTAPTARPSTPCASSLQSVPDGRHRRHRRGREGRGARCSTTASRVGDGSRARDRHRGRPGRRHHAHGQGSGQRARRHRRERAGHDVRPGPVRLHGEDRRRSRVRRRHRHQRLAHREPAGASPRRRASPSATSPP